MNRTLAFIFLLLSIGCVTDNNQSNQTNEGVKNDEPIVEDHPLMDDSFDIQLQIEKGDNDEYILVVAIELNNGSYIISPYSEDSTYGHFHIYIKDTAQLNKLIHPDLGLYIEDNKYLALGDSLLEIPHSIEEYDPTLERVVKFVRQNTTYKQKLTTLGKDDFESPGLIWFILEPSCIPFEVGFTIFYRSGQMEVRKTSTIGGCLKNCCKSKYKYWFNS